MEQIGAFTRVEDGQEKFFTVLACGCEYEVIPAMLFENDLPCPKCEEERYQ